MEKVTDAFQKMFLAGLGAISTSAEKAKEVVEELVKEGKMSREEGVGFVEDVIKKGESFGKEIEEHLSKAAEETMEKINVASHKELESLREEINRLKGKIDNLEGKKKEDKKESDKETDKEDKEEEKKEEKA